MNKVLIIAEAGVNHNGDLNIAKKMVDVASQASVDFIKFQTFKADTLTTKNARRANYQITNTGEDSSQYEMLKKLELSEQAHLELLDYCRKKNIGFLSTPFDESCADFLEDKVDFFKIPSGELTNHPFLVHLARKKKPLVLSTGMGTLDEVRQAVKIIHLTWKEIGFKTRSMSIRGNEMPCLVVLHCTTSYPVSFEAINLRAMNTMASELSVAVGYSDHSLSLDIPVAAVAMGATIIEKHFTLDRKMEGPDHPASLEPEELERMVSSIRNIEIALGSGKKVPAPEELKNLKVVRKSLYYKNNFPRGHKVALNDLIALRPERDVVPSQIWSLEGRKLKDGVEAGSPVQLNDFEMER